VIVAVGVRGNLGLVQRLEVHEVAERDVVAADLQNGGLDQAAVLAVERRSAVTVAPDHAHALALKLLDALAKVIFDRRLGGGSGLLNRLLGRLVRRTGSSGCASSSGSGVTSGATISWAAGSGCASGCSIVSGSCSGTTASVCSCWGSGTSPAICDSA
jgi:hypothetical protein